MQKSFAICFCPARTSNRPKAPGIDHRPIHISNGILSFSGHFVRLALALLGCDTADYTNRSLFVAIFQGTSTTRLIWKIATKIKFRHGTPISTLNSNKSWLSRLMFGQPMQSAVRYNTRG